MRPGPLTASMPPVGSFDYWLRLARGYVASATDEQFRAIAQLCVDTDCGVWHAAATVGNSERCWCFHCNGGKRRPVSELPRIVLGVVDGQQAPARKPSTRRGTKPASLPARLDAATRSLKEP